MGLISLEHGTTAYRADFAFYGAAVAGLGGSLLVGAPPSQALPLAGIAMAGLAAWSLLEYLLHRFVLHGLQPFRGWHAEHHARPAALICAPTLLSAALIVMLVYGPAWWLTGRWPATALSFGVVTGYLGYTVTHHATHHWRGGGAWLRRRKRWHARHHHAAQQRCFGVTSGLWDHAFGTAAQGRPARRL